MKPRVWINKIKFSDDSELDFEPNQITVFVGPNNTGKSAVLNELNTLTSEHKERLKIIKVIKDYELKKEGEIIDIKDYIKDFSIVKYNSSNPLPHYSGYNYNLYEGHFEQFWGEPNSLMQMQKVFVNILTTEERLKFANPPENIPITTQAAKHPIHLMQRDDTIEKTISKYFNQAFNDDLIINHNAGNNVPLYVGKRPKRQNGEDRVSRSYLDKLEKLPLLHEQGDGMRSFVSVLLSAFIAYHQILLIDEPEAFLHPPQARLLGKMLAKDLPKGKQLFFATHSGDFLRGLLEADISNLKIVRIQRNKNINYVSELNNSDIKELWNDSLLRYSYILDGLFHSKVIVCESDSDCRFYSAVLQSLYENKSNIRPDFLFTHCGGKHRVATVVNSLKKLNVAIKVIVDFDILNDTKPLKEIYEACGGNWSKIESDWKLVNSSINDKHPELETDDLKKEIRKIINPISTKIFPQGKVKEIKILLNKTSAWAEAKKSGKSYIPSGDATNAYSRLIENLEKKGILVVEVGELEGFDKSIGNHGPKWVNEVLKKDLINDQDLSIAREFVRKLIYNI
ncbi:ATP-dependent endonuclease [Candidatus Latescibacterota bacterium]